MEVETLSDGSVRAVGFPIRPRLDYIFVLDLGQPDVTRGGIVLGDSSAQHWRYRYAADRYGTVVGVGPGRFAKRRGGTRVPMEGLAVGEVVMFERKYGTRLGVGWRFQHPEYPSRDGLLIRVLDPEKVTAVMPEEWRPWWDVAACQLDPGAAMSG